MATITTVVLSIASRSVTEVEISNKEEDSLRAFSAAETGIEQALVAGSIGQNIANDLELPTSGGSASVISNYSASVNGFPNNSSEFAYPYDLYSGDSGAVWMVTRNGVTTLPCGSSSPCFTPSDLKVCWGAVGTGANTAQTPALELMFIYENPAGSYHTTKAFLDPYSARRTTNKFDAATTGSCNIAGESYAFNKQFNSTDLTNLGLPPSAGSVKLMKVRFLYNTLTSHSFGVSSSGLFPSQGKQVSSVGQAGNSKRKIEAYLLNPALPSVFDAAIYSGTDIVK